eukprot:COSAG01_NODE_12769_length_1688_cov_5.480176_1_plen_371_part_00
MGCPGMLRMLRGAADRGFQFKKRCRGSTVGVDAFIWLHLCVRNNYRDAVEAGSSGAPDYTSTIQALKEMVLQYVANGIRVFMVFDGRRLPGKNGTDAARLKKRCAAQAQVDAAVERAEAKANARRSSSKAGKALRKTASDMAEDLDAGTFEIEIEEKTLRAAAAVTDILMLLLALVSLLDRYPVFVRKCFRDGGVGCWPLNLYGAHWCGLVVDGRRRRFEPQASAVGDTCQTIDGRRLRSGEQYMFVGYFDSMGGPCPPTLLSAVRRAIRRTRHEQGDSACTWAWAADLGVMANMQALQNADTYQCGVWTLLFESFVLRFVSTKAPGSLRSWLRACAGIPLDAHTRSVWMPNYAAESQSPKTCHYADKLC